MESTADGDGNGNFPLRPKYATFINHTAQHTAHSARWPGMRMSSRAALERSNSFRIRVFAYSHSYSWTYSYSFSEPTAGSSCACGALFFFGAPIDLLGAFSSQLHIFVAFAALKYENQCGGSTLCHCKVVGVSSVSVSLCFPCINSSGSLCVCARHATTKRHVSAHCEVGQRHK